MEGREKEECQKNKVGKKKKRDGRAEKQAGKWKSRRGNVLCVMTPDERLFSPGTFWGKKKTVNKVQRVSQQS